MTPDWSRVAFWGPPQFLVGWRRSNKQLVIRQLQLHQDVFNDILEMPRNVLGRLSQMSPVPDSAYVEPERGEEFLWIPSGAPRTDHADIVSLLLQFDNIEMIDASSFDDAKLEFYAVGSHSSIGRIAFVRKTSPKRTLERGNRFFKFSDTLRKVEQPDIVIEDVADVVVCELGTAVISPFAFGVLAADVGFSQEHVDDHVADISLELEHTLPISTGSRDALSSVGHRKVSVAKRLRVLASRLPTLHITTDIFRDRARERGLDSDTLLGANGELIFDETSVDDFLDLVEGRLFTLDFEEKAARADRFRYR